MESAQDCRATPLDRAMSALCQKRTLALEYEMPANIDVCTAAMTSPAAAPIIVKPTPPPTSS